MNSEPAKVKVYHGYGHTHKLTVFGHVFRRQHAVQQQYSKGLLANLAYLVNIFRVEPYPFAKVRLQFRDQVIYNKAEYDGFFRFEFSSVSKVEPGWHEVSVSLMEENGQVGAASTGLVYVPHITQYTFISDIDDTLMVSHSATLARRLRELFLRNPRSRRIVPGMATYFKGLAASYTSPEKPNPFFYVSSSEWNLYDYLVETFRYNRFPEGSFLLNQVKQLKDFLHTGKTGHGGKLLRIMRILEAFPNQKFVLFGDNSQQDPIIYRKIAEKHPDKIAAIYIRNAHHPHAAQTAQILKELAHLKIPVCHFNNSEEAMKHSRRIGLFGEKADLS